MSDNDSRIREWTQIRGEADQNDVLALEVPTVYGRVSGSWVRKNPLDSSR